MNTKWDNIRFMFIWSIAIFSVAILIYSYIQYCKDYDSKIKIINRYSYIIKFENGRALVFTEDKKNEE
jgi:hypothetical protein